MKKYWYIFKNNNKEMNISSEDIEYIVEDDTSYIFSVDFKVSSEEVLDEVDGDPWWVVYTEEYYNYMVYHRDREDTFFVILTVTTVETDNRIREITEKIYYYDYDNINNSHSHSHSQSHFHKILENLEEYKKKREDIKDYFNNIIYYELMEKTLHPDRLEWVY